MHFSNPVQAPPYINTRDIKPFSGFRLKASPPPLPEYANWADWSGDINDENDDEFRVYFSYCKARHELWINNMELFIPCGSLKRVREKLRIAMSIEPNLEYEIIENIL